MMAISPPFPLFLVETETIPPVNNIIATIILALPLTSPFPVIEFPSPAAHDWNETRKKQNHRQNP